MISIEYKGISELLCVRVQSKRVLLTGYSRGRLLVITCLLMFYTLPIGVIGLRRFCEGNSSEICSIDRLNPARTKPSTLRLLTKGVESLKLSNLETSTLDHSVLNHILASYQLRIIDSRALQRMIVPHNVTVLRLVVTNTQLGWIHFQENGSILTVSIISSNLQLLPPSLKNLANLTHLKIQQSYIQHLNFDILQWFQRLQTVDLKYNKIHTITSSPNGKRPKLSVLLLSNNQLKILNLEVLTPLGWFNLIDLSHNELELVVGRFASNSLSRMLFTHNRLKALDFCQWQPMPSMSSISFESNELTVVPNCMGHFPRLSYVSFSSNWLTKINMAAFGTLDNLQTVDLSFNRISLITFREDRYPMRLEELVLRDNNIECSNPPDIPFCPLDIEFYRISPRQHETLFRKQLTITTA